MAQEELPLVGGGQGEADMTAEGKTARAGAEEGVEGGGGGRGGEDGDCTLEGGELVGEPGGQGGGAGGLLALWAGEQ